MLVVEYMDIIVCLCAPHVTISPPTFLSRLAANDLINEGVNTSGIPCIRSPGNKNPRTQAC